MCFFFGGGIQRQESSVVGCEGEVCGRYIGGGMSVSVVGMP